MLQRCVLEGDHAAAVAADRVVMMVAVGLDALVTGHAASDLDAADQAEFLELLERPVDARAPDSGATLAQLVVKISSAVTAQSWRASASTTAVRAPPAAVAGRSCRTASACSAQAVSVAVAISADRSLCRHRPPAQPGGQPAGRKREDVGGDDRQRDRGAAGGAGVVGQVEAGEAGEERDRRRRAAIIGTIRSVRLRAAAAGPTKTATTSRLPRPWTATTIAAASRTISAASASAGEAPSDRAAVAVEADRQQAPVQQQQGRRHDRPPGLPRPPGRRRRGRGCRRRGGPGCRAGTEARGRAGLPARTAS